MTTSILNRPDRAAVIENLSTVLLRNEAAIRSHIENSIYM